MKTIIAGSILVTNYEKLLAATKLIDWEITEVVSGKAKGVDALGEAYGRQKGLPIHEYPAEWSRFGRAAGPIRNDKMAKDRGVCSK